MGRRRDDSFFDGTLELLKVTPAWVGPILALVLFCVARFLLPPMFGPRQLGFDTGVIMRQVLPALAWVLAAVVLLAWVIAEVTKFADRRRLDQQSGIESIRRLSWQEFERLVCEAYRRQGYLAEAVGSASGDDGVDVRLTGHGETVLVQAKHWQVYRVGVRVVRELLGVVTGQRADRGILVTSGTFTREAQRFAAANPRIVLLDGEQLGQLVSEVQTSRALFGGTTPSAALEAPRASGPSCPSCGATMVQRTARRGSRAGSSFWGCQRYPACRGTRPMAE